MQQNTSAHLSAAVATAFLEAVPEKIRVALEAYAEEIDYPVEAVVEMMMAKFGFMVDSVVEKAKVVLG